jgi:uncharacterized FAD-dependent dehydrogenase
MRSKVERLTGQADDFRVGYVNQFGFGEEVTARRVVVAVGRRGQQWWQEVVRDLELDHTTPVSSVGVRFECSRELLEAGNSLHPDFKTTVIRHGVKVKTFCFCAGAGGGKIKFTDYGDVTLLDGHVIPDGHGTAANFALLAQLRNPAGEPRPREWVTSQLLDDYAKLRVDRPGKPIMQSYSDFRRKRVPLETYQTFAKRVPFHPSVADLEAANLASILPEDIHAAFCQTFDELLTFFNPDIGTVHSGGIPDTVADSIAVIGLELESMWDELHVDEHLQTTRPGLYACGDCAGLAQGVLQSATSGLAAARHIAKELASG